GGLLEGAGTLEDSHDVAFLHDQILDSVELDLGAGPLAEQNTVTGLDVERDKRALLVAGTRTDSDDLAFHRLFLGRVRNDDAALGLLFFRDALDHDAIVKRTELHAAASINPGFAYAAGMAATSGLSALSHGECQRRTGFRVVSCSSQDKGGKVSASYLAS